VQIEDAEKRFKDISAYRPFDALARSGCSARGNLFQRFLLYKSSAASDQP